MKTSKSALIGKSSIKGRLKRLIKETIRLTDLNIPRQEFFAKNSFTLSAVGENEIQIDSLKGLSYNQTYPPDILRSQNFYHRLVLPLEKFFAQENIFVRFYLIRIFSVLLGTLIIFLFYQIIKSAGFSIKNSLLLTSLAVFQPKFSTYLSNINYDALLILAFALFTLAGIWVLKNGFGWKNGSLLLSALALGLLAKGTSIALLLMLLFLIAYQIYKIYQKTADKKKALIYIFTLLFLLILVLWLFSAKYNIFSLLPIQENLSLKENILSFKDYVFKTSSIISVSKNYWGDLGWTRDNIDKYLIYIIWLAEFLAVFGLGWLFFSKKKLDFLPEKKYLFFSILMIFVLQFSIRLYDWRVLNDLGEILLGTPGRYFLPNLAAHLILVATGLGYLLRQEKYLEKVLTAGLILMFFFAFYQIFNVILPRFYL